MEGNGRERKRRPDPTEEYNNDGMHASHMGCSFFDNSVASIKPPMNGYSDPAVGSTLEAARHLEIESMLKSLVNTYNQLDNAQLDACNAHQHRITNTNTSLDVHGGMEPTDHPEIEYMSNLLSSFDNQPTNGHMDAYNVYQDSPSCMNAPLAPSSDNTMRTTKHTELRISKNSAFTPYNEYALRQQQAAARAEEESRLLLLQQIEAALVLIQQDMPSPRSGEILMPIAEHTSKKSEAHFTGLGQRDDAGLIENAKTHAANDPQDMPPSSKNVNDRAIKASKKRKSHKDNHDETLESSRSPENWMKQYDSLKAYIDKHGEYPSAYKSTLGVWTSTQRSRYKSKAKNFDSSSTSSMVAERIGLLESLPNWTWDFNEPTIEYQGPGGTTVKISLSQQRHQERWLKSYSELKIFLEKNKRYPTMKESLGKWIHTQRSAYKKLKSKHQVARGWPECLEAERIRLLEQLPEWKWDNSENSANRPDHKAWSKKFNELAAYLQRNNGLFPPPHWIDGHQETKSLSKWISGQKEEFNRGKLEQHRVQALESLPGWSFTKPLSRVGNAEGLTLAQKNDALWLERFNSLKSYLQENNNLYPSDKRSLDVPAPIRSLGQWIHAQRRAYKDGTLAQDRMQKLSTLPGWSFTEPLARSRDF